MLTVDDLMTNGRAMLSAVTNAANQLNFVLPARRYVTVGGSVYDCPQVTVSVMHSDAGDIAPGRNPKILVGPCDPTWNVTYEIGIVLTAVEAATGPRGETLPTTAAIETDTTAMSAAYATLANALSAISGSVTGPMRGSIMFGQPQGGLIAVVATITANLWF